MKKFLSLCVTVLIMAFASKAQVAITAVLVHNDEVSTFQSSSALADAVSKAVEGDVISLSSGNFAAVDIDKNITIRGAGMMPGENPTVISGRFNINIASESSESMTFEGVYIPDVINMNQAGEISFLKCWIYALTTDQKKETTIKSARFIHCFITSYCSFGIKTVSSAQFVNSYIKSFKYGDNGAYSFMNCIGDSGLGAGGSSTATVTNCILQGSTNTSTSYFNCVSNSGKFNNQPVSANNQYIPNAVFFKEDSDRYELTDEYAATLLGNDGTQVGIHGGSLPFDPATSNLKIKKFNVAERTTADGKLPIEIEVAY